MSKNLQLFYRIQNLRERYYKAAIDKESLVKLIYDSEVAEQVYNSNAIENSTLTLEETEKILHQIDLDRFINEREMFETKNLARVVEYIHKTAIEKELSLDVILLLHKMLISNIRDDIAGRFRNSNEWVQVGNHIAPNPKEILELMKKMLMDYQVNINEHIIKVAGNIFKIPFAVKYIHNWIFSIFRIIIWRCSNKDISGFVQ